MGKNKHLCFADLSITLYQVKLLDIYRFIYQRNIVDNESIVNETYLGTHRFIFTDLAFEKLTPVSIAKHSSKTAFFEKEEIYDIYPSVLEINGGRFANKRNSMTFPIVTVMFYEHQLLLMCECMAEEGKLCEHQAQVLTAIVSREELSVFFNAVLRQQVLQKFASDYGLENEARLDAYFGIDYQGGKLVIAPLQAGMMAVTNTTMAMITKELLPQVTPTAPGAMNDVDGNICIVLKQHKYYKFLLIELYDAQTKKDGQPKNPMTVVSPLGLMWQSDHPDYVKFFSGISKFQQHPDGKRCASDIMALKAIIKNPAGYGFYIHDSAVSENVSANAVTPVKMDLLSEKVVLSVSKKGMFYEIGGGVTIHGNNYTLNDLEIKFSYFISIENTLYLIDQLPVLALIALLKKSQGNILVHASKYADFKHELLEKLEDKMPIDYQYLEKANSAGLKELGFNTENDKIIYLSDFGEHVMIIPVMRYGDVEIPIRTRRQIHAMDGKGKDFLVERDIMAEQRFATSLINQHPFFEDQLENDLYYFYLHKKRFLEADWFLNAFEQWQLDGIVILGFNEIAGNKLNPNKVKIDIKVISGLNWFNAEVKARFGRKKASLKLIQKAIRNKSKYVQLDDGTLGILPAEWIEKFTNYFNAGELTGDEIILIPKINFSEIDKLYDEDMLDEALQKELAMYQEKLSDFDTIEPVEVPAELQATLRPYQKTGLNWLNFLDNFNFGGCLADDMGLGKSIQIIAFILSQRRKSAHNTNLLVVPATLIFNWQAEVEKFAPSIKIHTIYGTDRIKSVQDFDNYEIILTSYGTLISDIHFIKEYTFNYIFLDESQNIKNPETQRYKTVRLLKSRNRIAITGTPIENNTFDIYGQLSFACPGLLGNKQYFRDVYSIPIDKFQNKKRAADLQQKIKAFVLRRTKQEVAKDLPEKTEMVLYCEMGKEQRKIYDAYEKEFREYIAATTGEELKKSPMNVLKGLTKLRQVCNSPLLLGSNDLRGTESAKMDMLMEQLEGKIQQHKILIFSQFVSMLDVIKNELINKKIRFSYLTGSTKNREAVVNEFQSDDNIKVFLISLKAGGTGLNLTEADYVYLVDPWWNPAVENQAIDRVHRIGQDKKVVAVRMICPDTVEEKIMKMQESKRHLVRDLVSANDSFIGSLSKEDLLQLLKPL